MSRAILFAYLRSLSKPFNTVAEEEDMRNRITSRIIIASMFAFVMTTAIGITIVASHSHNVWSQGAAADRLAVHEWGTFTSIAGKNGIALDWRPLNGPSDLPKFVYTVSDKDRGIQRVPLKGQLRGLVRMETPILYFYSDTERDVDVKVEFPQGKITEWYPQAHWFNQSINWKQVKLTPGAALHLPVENTESHYYPARETDAVPLQVAGINGKRSQQEKFLFYRGVASFDLPLSVRLEGGKVLMQNLDRIEISHLLVFENRGGKIGYQVINNFATGQKSLERPALARDLDLLLAELKQILVGSGLYEREADAMIKTWRNSWFEEGMRVLYILPRQTTDYVLPLTVVPAPMKSCKLVGHGSDHARDGKARRLRCATG